MQEIMSDEDRAKMQRALDLLSKWASEWGMMFNVNKCKVMHVKRHNPMYEYFMGGKKLATSEEEKDIGIYVTSNLKPCSNKSRCCSQPVA
jgi:hypothetical protein